MIIVLLGYMASGKSTVGKLLAEKLQYCFIDLDEIIEKNENASISELFEQKGEIYFRRKESLYLNELIKNNDKIVLSLGGGTPCYGNNMSDLIKNDNVMSIYLKASIPTLSGRLQNEQGKRPLISHLDTKEALTEFIGKHIFERSTYYNQAHLTINADDKSLDELTEDLILELF